jgi:hypothetical protein
VNRVPVRSGHHRPGLLGLPMTAVHDSSVDPPMASAYVDHEWMICPVANPL